MATPLPVRSISDLCVEVVLVTREGGVGKRLFLPFLVTVLSIPASKSKLEVLLIATFSSEDAPSLKKCAAVTFCISMV